MSIATRSCPYCLMDTGGNHQPDCPIKNSCTTIDATLSNSNIHTIKVKIYYYSVGYQTPDDCFRYSLAHTQMFSIAELKSMVKEAMQSLKDEIMGRLGADYFIFYDHLACYDYFIFEDCNILSWLCNNYGFWRASPFTACYVIESEGRNV